MSTQIGEELAAAAAIEAEPDGRRKLWELRLIEASGLREWQLALTVIAVCWILSALVSWLAGPLEQSRSALDTRLPYLVALVLGCFLFFYGYAFRRGGADLELLRPSLTCSPEAFAALERSLTHHSGTFRWGAGGTGLLVAIVIPELTVDRFTRLLVTGDWNLFDLWMTVYGALYWWIVVRVGAATVALILVFRRIGAELIRVRLFDRELGAPLARFGLRAVVLSVIPFVILGVAVAWGAAHPAVAGSGLVFSAALSIVAMLAPATGLRRSIRKAKQLEIERIDRAIEGDKTALEHSEVAADADSLRFVDLLAYRREVESVREWPFDAPVVGRFALIVLLPLLSWIAAALVERLVDWLLAG